MADYFNQLQIGFYQQTETSSILFFYACMISGFAMFILAFHLLWSRITRIKDIQVLEHNLPAVSLEKATDTILSVMEQKSVNMGTFEESLVQWFFAYLVSNEKYNQRVIAAAQPILRLVFFHERFDLSVLRQRLESLLVDNQVKTPISVLLLNVYSNCDKFFVGVDGSLFTGDSQIEYAMIQDYYGVFLQFWADLLHVRKMPMDRLATRMDMISRRKNTDGYMRECLANIDSKYFQ